MQRMGWKQYKTLMSLVATTFLLMACREGETRSEPKLLAEEQVAATDNAIATLLTQQLQASPAITATSFVLSDELTLTPTLLATVGVPATPTPTSPAEQTPSEGISPTPAVAFAPIEALRGDHFWLARPFYPDNSITAEKTYLYGVRRTDGQLLPHRGLDFGAAYGAVVNAAASGTVFFAGDEFNEKIFGPQVNFYGNVVVLEHQLRMPDTGELYRLYTLYGHLSKLYVETGDTVAQFDPIGEVGASGVAIGPHLHFEVRIGDPYDYGSTYNPILWLQPWRGYGVLAGRVTDAEGEPLYGAEVKVIDRVSNRTIYTNTYEQDSEANANPWHKENFAVPDLAAGSYDLQVSYWGRLIDARQITIYSDKTTMVYVTMQ